LTAEIFTAFSLWAQTWHAADNPSLVDLAVTAAASRRQPVL
jgi:hypothetical protein